VATLTFLHSLTQKYKVMPPGVMDANACTSALFSGRAGMMLLSTGALSFVEEGMKTPFKTAFVPANIMHAAPIGGGSLIIPKGNSPERQEAAWTLINWLTSPAIAGGWSRFTGYFAPNKQAYDLPEMKQYMAQHPNAKTALDQLNLYGRSWFATYRTVPVRKAMEDQLQALLSGRVEPAAAAAQAQKDADALLRPYVAQTAMKLPS
jgi:sn-glycerol 3-phosphate transport system substrate-binding protein